MPCAQFFTFGVQVPNDPRSIEPGKHVCCVFHQQGSSTMNYYEIMTDKVLPCTTICLDSSAVAA